MHNLNFTNISLDFLDENTGDYNSNYSYYDMSDDCYDIDCIWSRERRNRLSILRPLTFILSMIGLIGIIGNSLVITVFSRSVQKRTSTYLVLLLAILDLIACSIVIPGTLLKEWLFKFKSDLICKLWELLRNCAILSSAMILAAIAFDRFLIVYHKNTQDGSKHVTMAMILVTVLVGIALGVPPMLGVGVYMESFQGLINIEVCKPNDQIISAKSLQIYWQVITGLFSVLIVTIIILYSLIFIMVYKHSTRIRFKNQVGPTSNLSPTDTMKMKISAIMPFMGYSKSERHRSNKPKSALGKTKQSLTGLQKPHEKLKRLFKKSSLPKKNEVITIKVIGNSISATSSDSAIEEINSDLLNPEPGPSGLKPKQAHMSPANQKLSTLTPTNQNSNVLNSANQRQALIRNRSAHIKTTKVLCIITTVYIIAFLPMFLITHGALERNPILFYLYFINNAANPIIYSFMNRKFRQDVREVFFCHRGREVPRH